ncbi:HK97-gp10 family putative phage morphogenesis protein [Kitasatospora sp. NPDC058170]|uniref:HK97-gp10 family putative phage morphogenesis protein n=1 Tax=Kitasatospora sp. NPDC058170 TaxID=3346364 RepID=UPI0036DF7E36
MADSAFTVRVEGLEELKRAMRQLKDSDLNKAVREVNKTAAEIVKPEARKTAPSGHRSRKDNKRYKPGKLEKSITVLASANSAVVKAGSASRVPYAGAIHFGFPRRHIRPNRFLFRAMARTSDQVSETYEREISEVLRDKLEN